jgi:hypothetical protein
LLAVALISACVDTSPIAFDGFDAGTTDVAADGHALAESCRQCVQAPDEPGPGCAALWAECVAEPRCEVMAECAIDRGCLSLHTVDERTACSLPCADMVGGVTSGGDPIVPLILRLNVCSLDACRDACLAEDDAGASGAEDD